MNKEDIKTFFTVLGVIAVLVAFTVGIFVVGQYVANWSIEKDIRFEKEMVDKYGTHANRYFDEKGLRDEY